MIIRKTTKCPISGDYRTKIWKKTCFSKTLLYDYGLEWKEIRTIGFRENHDFNCSVALPFGQLVGKKLYYKNYLHK